METKYQAIIFDMDGLLLDTELTGRWAWNKALENHGYQMTDEIYLEFVGRDMSHRETVLKAYFGQQFPFESVKNQRISLGDAKETQDGLLVKPGVLDLLRILAKMEIPMGLATGTIRSRTLRRLASTGIHHYFSAIVTGEDVLHGKPAPDLFLEASRIMQIDPQQCVVFEDSCAGIKAASAAGMCPIMVPDLEKPSIEIENIVYCVLSSLENVDALLEKLFDKRRKNG